MGPCASPKMETLRRAPPLLVCGRRRPGRGIGRRARSLPSLQNSPTTTRPRRSCDPGPARAGRPCGGASRTRSARASSRAGWPTRSCRPPAAAHAIGPTASRRSDTRGTRRRNRADGSPAGNSDARCWIRSNSHEPTPRPRCPGCTTPGLHDGRFLADGLPVSHDRVPTADHHPGVGGEIEAHPAPVVSREVHV
jgi:hypothetical protein